MMTTTTTRMKNNGSIAFKMKFLRAMLGCMVMSDVEFYTEMAMKQLFGDKWEEEDIKKINQLYEKFDKGGSDVEVPKTG